MITVFGSISLDQIGTLARFPQPGETVAGHGYSTAPGGKGANQALAVQRAGAAVRLVGAVGDDDIALASLSLLRVGGVDLSAVRVAPGHTGIAMVSVDAQGENLIAVYAGANGALTIADADLAANALGPNDYLLLQQEIPQVATARALQLASQRGATAILNTAPFLDDTAALAPLAGILVANESEFCLLAQCASVGVEAAMFDWHNRHGQPLIVTMGPDGAVALYKGQRYDSAASPILATDTVGAGDTFCGYLAAGLAHGLAMPSALHRAVRAASLACTRPGAQPGIPHVDEVDSA